MKTRFNVFLLFLVPFLSRAQDKIEILASGFVYNQEQAPTPECHASTIASTPQGPVMAWFGGTHEKNKDVGIWFSRLRGGQWAKPVEVANGIISPSERYPCWNPVLFQQKRGPLFLFYKVGPSPSKWWGMLIRSLDGGNNWTKPERIPPPFLGPVKNKPIIFDSILYCPSSSEHDGWNIHLETFNLKTGSWTNYQPIHPKSGYEVIQPTLLVHPQGILQLLNRSKQGIIVETWSSDRGRTWSPFSASLLPNPNSGIDGISLKNGSHLLVYNHSGIPKGKWGGNRFPLNLALSRDGHHWKTILTLEDQAGEFSYPAIIQSEDGLVHIAYTYNRKTIKYLKVKVDGGW